MKKINNISSAVFAMIFFAMFVLRFDKAGSIETIAYLLAALSLTLIFLASNKKRAK